MFVRSAGYALAIVLGLQSGTAMAQSADYSASGSPGLFSLLFGTSGERSTPSVDPADRAGLDALNRVEDPVPLYGDGVSGDARIGMATSAPQQAQLSPGDGTAAAGQSQLPPRFREQVVDYATKYAPGTIVIDTPHTYLYYVLGHGKAVRYGIGVGREGFTWSGHERITRMAEWPDWIPPVEMLDRQPYLPRFMAGGPGNPLGARALYLGGTVYRIHGTNDPSTIGKFISSGCIRMANAAVENLYQRVHVGTPVVVLPKTTSARR